MSQQLSKRSRRTFVWTRFLARSGPSLKGYKFPTVFKATEQPPRALVKMLSDMYRDDPLVIKNSDAIKSYGDALLNGTIKTHYELTDYKDYAPTGYEGLTEFGRAHTGAPSVLFPSKILNTFYRNTHVEVDVVNCFPTMLNGAFGHLGLPAFDRLVHRRQDVLNTLREELGLSAKEAKKLIVATISAYPGYGFGLEGERKQDRALISRIQRHQIIKAVRDDLKAIAKAIEIEYADFYVLNRNRAVANGKMESFPGLAIQSFAEDMEFVATRKIIDKVFGGQVADTVWKYDGLFIPKTLIEGDQSEWVEELSADISEQMGFGIGLELKNPAGNAFAVCIPDNEITSPYEFWKRGFEKTFFRVSNPPVFGMITDSGSCIELNDSQFNHNTMEQPKEFMKQWKEDPEKRKYIGFDNAPPPLECRPGYYNRYLGLAAEKLNPVEDEDVNLDMYKQHVELLMGGPEESLSATYADYFHHLMAHKIQHPGLNSRVIIFMWSIQGGGKDVLFDFLSRMFGYENVIKFGTIKAMVSESAMIDSKLLACVSEASYADTKAHIEELKDLVTSSHLVVKKKYVNSYRIRNTTTFFVFSNSSDAFVTTGDDRRLFPVRASGRHANDPDYFQKLIPYLEDNRIIRGVYQWYANMELGDFDPSAARPITTAFKDIAQSSANILEMSITGALDDWIREMGDGYAGFGGERGNARWRNQEKTILQVKSSEFVRWFMSKASDMGYQNADVRHKMVAYSYKLQVELNARASRFKTIPDTTMKYVMENNRGSGGVRYKLFDVRGIQTYVFETVTGGNDEGENHAYAPGFNPGQQSTIHRRREREEA